MLQKSLNMNRQVAISYYQLKGYNKRKISDELDINHSLIKHYDILLREMSFEEYNQYLQQLINGLQKHLNWVKKKNNKPEVDSSQPLDVKQEGGNGVPPTPKECGYPA